MWRTNEDILITSLTVLGVWPLATRKDFHRHYRLLLHATLTVPFAVLMWLELFHSDGLDYFASVLKYALAETMVVLKVFNLWHYSPLVAQLLHDWRQSDTLAPRRGSEWELWQRDQRGFRKVLFFYVICSISSGVWLFSGALVGPVIQMPFPYWLPMSWRTDYFWQTIAYDAVAMGLTCSCNITIDMFQCFLLLQLALSYKIIGMRLQNLPHNTSDVEVRLELVRAIRMQRRIKNIANSVERIISLPVLAQILLSSFMICFVIYQLQNVSFLEDLVDVFGYLQFVLSISLQIFLPCYYANKVTIASQELSTCLYSSEWIDMSPLDRRLIYIYMEQLKYPVTLRAGKFFQIGLPVFSKVMNNAYSLLALIVNISEDNDSA